MTNVKTPRGQSRMPCLYLTVIRYNLKALKLLFYGESFKAPYSHCEYENDYFDVKWLLGLHWLFDIGHFQSSVAFDLTYLIVKMAPFIEYFEGTFLSNRYLLTTLFLWLSLSIIRRCILWKIKGRASFEHVILKIDRLHLQPIINNGVSQIDFITRDIASLITTDSETAWN